MADMEKQEASFQDRASGWAMECFGPAGAVVLHERVHRFLEEGLELAQSLGCMKEDAHTLVDYVFGRPVGEPPQEAGGTMVGLAILCNVASIDLDAAAETELARCWKNTDRIRAKWQGKPKLGPLPGPSVPVVE